MMKIIPSFPVQIPAHHQHNYEPSKHNFDTWVDFLINDRDADGAAVQFVPFYHSLEDIFF